MRFDAKKPARRYHVGVKGDIEISDCGSLAMDAREQVTFITEAGGEYDVTRTSFGFYATPSLEQRLPRFGLRPVLIRNRETLNHFVLLVEDGQEAAFEAYLEAENLEVVIRLDDTETLKQLYDLGQT